MRLSGAWAFNRKNVLSTTVLPHGGPMPMSETILYVLAGTLGLLALAASAVAWRFLCFLRYQETEITSLRQDLTSARRELSFEAERAQRILGSSAGPMLSR